VSRNTATNLGEKRVGRFAGPIAGLAFHSASGRGLTNARGEFIYVDGEAVTFSIGHLVLGSTRGAAWVNLSNLANRVAGNIDRLHDPAITNLARLVFSLGKSQDLDGSVELKKETHDLVSPAFINFNLPEAAFGNDANVVALLEKLNASGQAFTDVSPRGLMDGATARNELRRNIRGIIKHTNVRIPTRDGSYVCADVFRPAADGPHPVVMSKGFYGKAFYHECICNDHQAVEKEQLEDRFFSGNPDGLQYENHETPDTATWVPDGYVCIRVDDRGVGQSPGLQAPWSVQQAHDYYDAIEWAGVQPWSNGNVGLWGMSYLAMVQHNVASLQPPHLKAMIAQGTDADIYNEALYGGGIFGEGFWSWWWKAWSGNNFCGTRNETDWMARALATPFNDPAAYGPEGTIFMRPDLAKALAPVWITGPQAGAVIHQLGSSETYIHSTGAKAKRFDFNDAWFANCYASSTVSDHKRFFDHWLKGIDNGVMDEPSVRIQLRTGNGSCTLMEEQEWPIARTLYKRWYLDASPSDWSGDGRRDDFMRVVSQAPTLAHSASYDAYLDLGMQVLSPMGPVGGTPRWQTGITFISDPMDEDMVMVGYMKAGLWVSSSASDMDVFVSVRVVEENGREIRFDAPSHPADPIHAAPVGHGLLKVSHRKLDEARTTNYWPVQSHLEADYAPLNPNEVVAVEVGLNPSSALIPKGARLRVDIQPSAPSGAPGRAFDESYHKGATNSVFTGPDHPSYIQLPIIPARSN
jgi:uncharacterized protein